MKLKKYQDKHLMMKKSTIVLLLFLCAIGIGLFVYQSFARYQDKATFRIINGKLKLSGGKGDIEFVFYNGDQKVDDILTPEKGFIYLGSKCDNGATVKWDNEQWVPTVFNLSQTKTSCSLYFGSKENNNACILYPESATCKYNTTGETAELLYDDTEDKNLRYVGATPKNYVYFNCEEGKAVSKSTCETWRIIGIMNNIEDEDGSIVSHLKIIRDSIGKYSWDSSASSVNRGYGVNEWSASDIEKVLNDEYLNRHNGLNLCYNSTNNSKAICPDWTAIGIRDEARNMIASIKWNTGTMPVAYNSNLITAKYMYEAERSNHTGKEGCQASSGEYCSDNVLRITIWPGKVGLMYPSDYGYAVGGNVRETCLGKSMQSYNSDSCMTNDWLYDKSNSQWTMTPSPVSSYANFVLNVQTDGRVYYVNAIVTNAIRPTLYLKSDVKIALNTADDYGSVDNPFVLEYSEN